MNIQENPYIGLRPYTYEDRDKFFGRDEEKQILFDKILANKLTLLFAASGVGKSSLLRAGVIPELFKHNYDVVYFFEWADQPELNLKQAILKVLKDQQRISEDYQVNLELPLAKFIKVHQLLCEERLIIILDQFEEFFNYARLKDSFKPFIESLSEAMQAHDTTTIFVLSMREDFALELNAFKAYVAGIFDNFYRLEKLTKQAAQQAILKPLEKVGFKFEENLFEQLLDDLSRREQIDRYGLEQALQMKDVPLFVEPPHLQIVCSQLWELECNQSDKTVHFKTYEKHGKAQGFLKNHFLSKISQLSSCEQKLASAAFDFLVNKHGTKMAYPLNDLAKLLRKDEKILGQTLNRLEQARILRKTERHGHHEQPILWFELYHDVFANSAYQWNEQFKIKQRRKKLVKIASVTIGSLITIGIGIDYSLNANFQHLRTNPKTNAIELYQGYLNSVDFFKQQHFLAEMPFEREQLEADKRFEKQSIDQSTFVVDLAGKLPVEKRIKAYLEIGELDKALSLANTPIQKNESFAQNLMKYFATNRTLDSLNSLQKIIEDQQVNPEIKQYISFSFSNFLNRGNIIDLLMLLLKNSDSFMRASVIDVLGKLQAKETIPQLIELLKDNNEEVRFSAIDALVKLQVKEVVPQLIELIEKKESSSNLINTLIKLEPKEAIPHLIKLLKDKKNYMRWRAIDALGKLQAKEAIPQLIELLKDKKSDACSRAMKALGQLQAKEAIPQLIELLKDSNLRSSAIDALGQLQVKEVIPQLIELLKDKESDVRFSAIMALIDLEKLQVKEAIPQLIEFLKDKDIYIRSNVIKALGKLQVKEIIPQLLPLLNHYDGRISISANSVLEQFKILKKPLLKKAKPQILPDFFCLKIQILNEESTNKTKVTALRMMGKLGGEEVTQFIIEHFEEFGVFAIQALGDTKQKVALAFLKGQLKQLEQDKKDLHQLREKENLNETEQQRFQQLQEQSYLETEVAYSIAKLDPQNEGIKLLDHPFLEVRNGAILGIGHYSNLNIFKELLNNFQNTTKPIFRFSLYRAMDVSLLTLETEHNDKDSLQTIHDSLDDASSPQHHALKQRLQWTINEIAYRQQHPKEDDAFEETPKETSDN